jgi:uncharacterized protein YndB with AHSA1/START domain
MSKNNLVVERDQLAFTMSRTFDAPRELVWKVYTDPDLVPQWWGLRSSTTIVDTMDFRVGGAWRYIQIDSQGNEYAFRGVYQDIQAPEQFTYTFEFEPMPGQISTDTIIFEALPDGKTLLTSRTTMDSLADLEGMLQSGMEDGATETWDRLEELLESEKVNTSDPAK